LIKFNFIKENTKSEQREDFAPGNPVPTSNELKRLGRWCGFLSYAL
jgi:hypothetical protein